MKDGLAFKESSLENCLLKDLMCVINSVNIPFTSECQATIVNINYMLQLLLTLKEKYEFQFANVPAKEM